MMGGVLYSPPVVLSPESLVHLLAVQLRRRVLNVGSPVARDILVGHDVVSITTPHFPEVSFNINDSTVPFHVIHHRSIPTIAQLNPGAFFHVVGLHKNLSLIVF